MPIDMSFVYNKDFLDSEVGKTYWEARTKLAQAERERVAALEAENADLKRQLAERS